MVIIMAFVNSKQIWNKIGEAHKLIINYCEFEIIDFEEFENNEKIGINYKIRADAYIDYIIGICDILDMKCDFECEDGELYYVDIYIENK